MLEVEKKTLKKIAGRTLLDQERTSKEKRKIPRISMNIQEETRIEPTHKQNGGRKSQNSHKFPIGRIQV